MKSHSLKSHTLDWTHAYTHRLDTLDASSSRFAKEAAKCARRLADELAAGTLPFINMPFRDSLKQELPAVLEKIRNYKHMLLLGIGGSALGARALQKAFFPYQDRPGHHGPYVWIADNIDADTLDSWMQNLDPQETVVLVISKSGGTIETMAQYFLIRSWLQDNLGDAWKSHVVAITDASQGALRFEAEEHGLLSLPVPDHLGGRYSVLSAVGLLPAAFMGLDYALLLAGAAKTLESLAQTPNRLAEHPAWHLALWNRELIAHGYDELIFFSYIPLWNYFGHWFVQLWAESLGKDGKGSMPVAAVGVTDQHSTNQMFLDGPRNKGCIFITCDALSKGRAFVKDIPSQWSYLEGKHFGDLLLAEGLGTRMALASSQVPLVHLNIQKTDERSAGSFMALLMATTLFTGWLLECNPLDQPAVELGKRLANARLGAPGYDKETQELQKFLAAQENNTLIQEW